MVITSAQARTILELAESATPEQVQFAYRKAARRTHPDVNPNDPEAATKFREVQAAYEMLGGNSIGGVRRNASKKFTPAEAQRQYEDFMRASFG